MFDDYCKERYSRQICFPQVGLEGQKKLISSSVVIIGCGALGSYLANGLTRAGIGQITIIDKDFVELSNLQRQIIFDENDVGKTKVEAVCEKLALINSKVKVGGIFAEVTKDNIGEFIARGELVLDGTDNFPTRFLINDACLKANKPWIFGAVAGSSGKTMNIVPKQTSCLRCFFPSDITTSQPLTCHEIGVISPIVQLITAIQITEALKLLLGKDDWHRELIYVDVWEGMFGRVLIRPEQNCLCQAKRD